MNKVFLLIILMSSLCWSCKSDKKPDNDHTDQVSAIENVADERIETYQIYMVTVDDLRVRDGAMKSTKVIDKLKEGSLVYSHGVQSSFTEKVQLRGELFDRPYQEVTYGDKKGWIYQGGLYKIYDSGEADSFTTDLDNVVLRLNRSNKRLLDKGEEILSVLRQQRSGSSEWNDMLFLLVSFHFDQILKDDKLYEPFENKEWSIEEYKSAGNKSYDMQSSEFSKSYARAGFKFTEDEGHIFPILDPSIIENAIGGPFGESLQSYIALKKVSANTQMFSDASIVTTMDSLVDYIILIERYITKYPNAFEVENVNAELEYLNTALLSGTANTTAISYQTKKLNPEWMEAWRRYENKNPQGLLIKEVKAKIEKHK